MPDHSGDKSQAPTPHRRQEARKQGQVAKSQDLVSAVLLIAGLLGLLMLGGGLIEFLYGFSRRQLGGKIWSPLDFNSVMAQYHNTLSGLAGCLLPIFGLVLLVAVAANLAQTGFLFVPGKLAPDVTRIDPLKGLRRLFSLPTAMRLAFGIFKIMVIAAVAFFSLYKERDVILGLSGLEPPQIGVFLFTTLFWITLKVGGVLLVLAILDYAFQRWKHEQDLRMTPQEIREEMKNLEGNPQIIARRRQVQRQLALDRLSDLVPKADVVVTNPTELAVAIQYEPETMAAPIVIAKGAGLIAQRIRRLALEHEIPVVEKKPLAQALYREVELNHPIPKDKYAAVAEVLAYVYQLKGKQVPAAPNQAA